ncbi:MAG: ComEC/Rec2 family competence protein [Actinomycetota bacterium]
MTSALVRRPAAAAQVDLRLACGAVAGWAAALLGLGRSPMFSCALGLAASCVGVVALLLGRRSGGLVTALALAMFCVALVALPLAGRFARARESPLARLARDGAEATVVITVTSDPRPLRAKGVAGSSRIALDATVRSVRVGAADRDLGGAVLVLAPADSWRHVLPGQRVRLDVRLQPPLGDDLLTATMVARSDPVPLGGPPWWQRMAGTVRSSLRQASAPLPPQPRGLLPGLVDGDITDLDPVLAERFRIAGLTHLVAVSGTNCSIVVGAVLLMLRRLRFGPLTCAVVGGVALVGFVAVARPSPSVLRAAVMAGIALVALVSGRQRDGLALLSAAVLGLLVWQPTLAPDVGFAMSVLATGALLLIAPAWAAALARRRVPPGIAESLAVAAAAHLVTAPLIVAISGRVSLVAVVANMLAEPVVAVTTVLGFGAALTAPLSLDVGSILAQLAGWPCRWLVWVAEFCGGLHGATVPWPAGLAGGLALVVVGAVLWRLARRRLPRHAMLAAGLVAVLLQIPVRAVLPGWPAPGWLLVACDVGQGDALVLAAGPHSAVIVDAGPDPVTVDRCLRDLEVTDVALLIFTHDHLDHVGGLGGVLHGRKVQRIITGQLPEPLSGARLISEQASMRGVPVSGVSTGQQIEAGRVRLDVLGPGAPFRGTRSDPNNSSVVLRATVGGVRFLLPGDAEIDAQQSLLAAHADLGADVLKVPHHGSAYSDPNFLAAVHARLAVISVGRHNDYGHPSPLLLTALARLGVPVRRTDDDGDIAVAATAGGLGTVLRGTRGSTVGSLSRQPALSGTAEAATARPAGTMSSPHATMVACRLAQVPQSTKRRTTGRPTTCPRSSYSWARKNCSSPERSSRSPPRPVVPIRTPTCVNGQGATSM